MTYTKWGASQTSKKHASGIMEYSTASHGGFHLSATRQSQMPEYLRNDDGWYEEDCDWCKVVIAFPEYFTVEKFMEAQSTLKNWHYKAYEKHTGLTLLPEESYMKNQDTFFEIHKNDMLVTSASMTDNPEIIVVCATLGGDRNNRKSEKRYLVPASEYKKRDICFIINDRHQEI